MKYFSLRAKRRYHKKKQDKTAYKANYNIPCLKGHRNSTNFLKNTDAKKNIFQGKYDTRFS